MGEVTVTVDIDERGRVTIPVPARKTLGVNGEKATLQLTIEQVVDDD